VPSQADAKGPRLLLKKPDWSVQLPEITDLSVILITVIFTSSFLLQTPHKVTIEVKRSHSSIQHQKLVPLLITENNSQPDAPSSDQDEVFPIKSNRGVSLPHHYSKP